MAEPIGAIRVEASIGTAEYVAGARKLKSETQALERDIKTRFSGMGAAVKGFGGALTAGLSIGLLAGFAKKALDFAAAIGTTAKQLGVTTKELQTFRYAANQVGITNAEADKSLERLGVTLGKAAAGSKTAQKALGAVGITLNDINTKTRTEIFGKIADQMNKQGGAAKNAAAANAILGESASKMTPLLDKGSQGINELAGAAERLGIVLSDRQIQQADETARKLEDVKTVLAAQIAGVVADNAASIVSLAQALGQLTSQIINFLGSNPQLALGILGALAGSRFGLPGAAAGALAGAYAGGRVAQSAADANTDINFRRQQVRNAKAQLEAAKRLPDTGGRRMPGTGLSIDRDTEVRKAVNELNRQTALLTQAAGARGGTAATGTAPIPQFLAGNPPRTRRARQGPRDRSDDVEFQFAQEARRAEMDVLRAKQELAGTSQERSRLALEMLALEKEMQDAEIDNRVRVAKRDFAEGKITAAALQQVEAQAEILKQKNQEAYDLQKQAVLRDRELDRMERAEQLDQRSYELKLDDLRFADEMAETQEEHRRIQLQIVDTLYDQKEAQLRSLKAQLLLAGKIEEAADVQDEINRLPAERARDKERVNRGTRGSLEAYYASLPVTADKMNAALQDVAVRGFQSLEDAIISTIDGTKSLADAFRDMASSIISDLLRISIQRAIIGPLVNAMMPAFGIPAPAGVPPGFAGGGSFDVMGRPGIDRNVLSLNGLPIARVSYGERMSISNDNSPSSSIPPFVFNNYARMSPEEARRTGMQAAAGWNAEMNRARSKGF